MDADRQPAGAIHYRWLERDDLARIGDIDRTERIDTLVVQRGTELEERTGDWSARAWFVDGDGEHSVAAQRRECAAYLEQVRPHSARSRASGSLVSGS